MRNQLLFPDFLLLHPHPVSSSKFIARWQLHFQGHPEDGGDHFFLVSHYKSEKNLCNHPPENNVYVFLMPFSKPVISRMNEISIIGLGVKWRLGSNCHKDRCISADLFALRSHAFLIPLLWFLVVFWEDEEISVFNPCGPYNKVPQLLPYTYLY